MVVDGRCKRGQDQATPYTVWANTQCTVDVEVKELRFQAHDTFLGESKAVVQELTWTGKKSMSQSTSCYSFKGDKVPVAMNETSSRELVVVNARHEYSPWSSRGLVDGTADGVHGIVCGTAAGRSVRPHSYAEASKKVSTEMMS